MLLITYVLHYVFLCPLFLLIHYYYYFFFFIRVGALVCDCGLQWLSMWLQQHRNNEAELHCSYPHWLQGMSLTQLHHANFTCGQYFITLKYNVYFFLHAYDIDQNFSFVVCSLSFLSLKFLLKFLDEYPKPRIIEEPGNQMSIKGDNVTLVCRATSTADAPLLFTWKHDNVELDSSYLQNNVASSESGVTEASSVLQLINVTHDNAGKYQCMVTNNYGTTYSAKVKLSVLGKFYMYNS